ncbi:MAG TPA: STAS domain-containing protein [Rectinemataceae bacterium]|nr:STAS domain-containing protein [Rectinemataceae bacterium]
MTQLDITTRNEEGHEILVVSGPINSYTFTEFQEKVYKAIRAGDTIIDMEKVTTLSSAGIGVLMAALDDGEAEGHRLVVLKPSEIVRLAMDSTGFADRFPVIQTLREF